LEGVRHNLKTAAGRLQREKGPCSRGKRWVGKGGECLGLFGQEKNCQVLTEQQGTLVKIRPGFRRKSGKTEIAMGKKEEGFQTRLTLT